LRAVDAYDPALGTSIEHYVRRVVLGAMLNGIRRLDPVSERARAPSPRPVRARPRAA
jgi:DNA-directed RNA polymerase specialized sigma subunit